MNPIRIGDRRIGPGEPALLAAEIGINHNGDVELALAGIDAAAAAGADAVKFQNYRTEDFLSDRSLTYEYVSQGKTIVEPQFDMFKRCELSRDALAALAKRCRERNVVFFSTPTGEDGIADLVEIGAPLLKNGSDYLPHLPLIRAMAKSGLPTVLSTGMATLAEIDDAVRAFRGAGGRDLIILHCTSSYPTPPADVHLRKIASLAAAFGCPTGLSDHTAGVTAAVGAVALGACMIEKHFTTNKLLPGPDHRFSADAQEFAELVRSVRELERCFGESAIGPTLSEQQGRCGFRLSCVAAEALTAGQAIGESDIAFRRPGSGLPPASVDWIVGRKLARSIAKGKVLEPEDFA